MANDNFFKSNEIDVLEWIKVELGHPFNVIELEDDYIVKMIIQKEALEYFSRFYPRAEIIDSSGGDIYPLGGNKILITREDFIGIEKIIPETITYDEMESNTYNLSVSADSTFAIKGKFIHERDLSSISLAYSGKFKELCLRMVAKKLLIIKRNANNTTNTVGEVAIEIETIAELVSGFDEWKKLNFDNIRNRGTRCYMRYGNFGSNIK